ncbi:MAG: DUF2232 domain-containing protein [Thermodesulfobacteriota bacterium]
MARTFIIWCFCLAALLVFMVGGRQSPIVNLFAISLTPLPVYLAGRRLGNLAALLLALAVSLLVFSLKPGLATMGEYLGFAELLLMGLLLSGLESRGYSADRAIIITVVALAALGVVFLSGQAYLAGMTPREMLSRKTLEITGMLTGVFSNGDTASRLEVLGVPLEKLKHLIQYLLPALVITNTGLVAWINVLLGRQVLVLLDWGKPEPPLNHWSTPEWLIFMVLAAGFLLLVPVSLVRLVSANVLVVLALFYFCQGVAVIATWLLRYRVPRPFRCCGYLIMFMHPLFLLAIIIGLADIWIDFRRLHQAVDA